MELSKNPQYPSQEEIDKFMERHKIAISENYKELAENSNELQSYKKLAENSEVLENRINDDFDNAKRVISQATDSLGSACKTLRDLHNIGDESSDNNLVDIRNKVKEHAITYKKEIFPEAKGFVMEIMDCMSGYEDLDEEEFVANINDFKKEAECNKEKANKLMELHTDILTKFKTEENKLIKFSRGLDANKNNLAVSIHGHITMLGDSISGFIAAFGEIAEFFTKLGVNLELVDLQIKKAKSSAKNKVKIFYKRFNTKSQEIYKSCLDYITSSVRWGSEIGSIE